MTTFTESKEDNAARNREHNHKDDEQDNENNDNDDEGSHMTFTSSDKNDLNDQNLIKEYQQQTPIQTTKASPPITLDDDDKNGDNGEYSHARDNANTPQPNDAITATAWQHDEEDWEDSVMPLSSHGLVDYESPPSAVLSNDDYYLSSTTSSSPSFMTSCGEDGGIHPEALRSSKNRMPQQQSRGSAILSKASMHSIESTPSFMTLDESGLHPEALRSSTIQNQQKSQEQQQEQQQQEEQYKQESKNEQPVEALPTTNLTMPYPESSRGNKTLKNSGLQSENLQSTIHGQQQQQHKAEENNILKRSMHSIESTPSHVIYDNSGLHPEKQQQQQQQQQKQNQNELSVPAPPSPKCSILSTASSNEDSTILEDSGVPSGTLKSNIPNEHSNDTGAISRQSMHSIESTPSYMTLDDSGLHPEALRSSVLQRQQQQQQEQEKEQEWSKPGIPTHSMHSIESTPSYMTLDDSGLHPEALRSTVHHQQRQEDVARERFQYDNNDRPGMHGKDATGTSKDDQVDQSSYFPDRGNDDDEKIDDRAVTRLGQDSRRSLLPTSTTRPGAIAMRGPVPKDKANATDDDTASAATGEALAQTLSNDTAGSQSSFASLMMEDDQDGRVRQSVRFHTTNTTPGALSVSSNPGPLRGKQESTATIDIGDIPADSLSPRQSFKRTPITTSTTPGAISVSGSAATIRGKSSSSTAMDNGDTPAHSLTPGQPYNRIVAANSVTAIAASGPASAEMGASKPIAVKLGNISTSERSENGPNNPRERMSASLSMTPPRSSVDSSMDSTIASSAATASTPRSRLFSRGSTKFNAGEAPATSMMSLSRRSYQQRTQFPTNMAASSSMLRSSDVICDDNDDPTLTPDSRGSVTPSYRSSAVATPARILLQEETFEDDENGEDMAADEQPGAFAVDRANTVRARVKDTGEHLRVSRNISNGETDDFQPVSVGSWRTNPSNQRSTSDLYISASNSSRSFQNDSNARGPPINTQSPDGTNGIITAQSDHVGSVSFRREQPINEDKKAVWEQRKWIILACGLIILAVAIAISVPLLSNDDKEALRPSPASASPDTYAPTAAPTSLERFQDFAELISRTISSPLELATEGSPQFQAVQWLADYDPAQLDPTDPMLKAKIQDRYAATVVYYSIGLNKQNSLPLSWWLTEDSICDWNDGTGNMDHSQGILCLDSAQPGTVTRITAEQNDAGGTIPSEICHFASLEQLYLSRNSLRGSLPMEIDECAKLVTLDLSVNSLSGPIPSVFTAGGLPRLENLALNRNEFSGTIPSGFFTMTTLEVLSISYNRLTGTLSTEFATLQNLRTLIVGGNEFLAGPIPTEIGVLVGLDLFLSQRSSLIGTIPTELGNLTNLKELNLLGNILDGNLPTELGELTQLTSIDVSFNFLTGTIPDFQNWTNLVQFNFAENDGMIGSAEGLCHSNQNLTSACVDRRVECSCCDKISGSCF